MSQNQEEKHGFFTRKRVVLLLITTNLIAIFLLLNIHFNISKVKKQRQIELSYLDTLKYYDNPLYIEQTELFNVYKNKEAKIVMMGSSFTQRVNWNELLERTDVVNRGIGSDVSEGYLYRLNTVLNLKPDICFVELGANDILKKIPVTTIFSNAQAINENIKEHGNAITVFTKCFFVSEKFPEYETFNLKVDSLNKMLGQLTGTILIDLNPQISIQKKRRPEYALADGIHLNAKAYVLWKNEIKKVLLEKKIFSE